MKTDIHFLSYLAQFLLEWEMFRAKVLEKIKTHILYSAFFFSNRAVYEGKKLFNIKCVFWFSIQILSETFLILRIIQRDIVISVHTSPHKAPVILVSFYSNGIFFTVPKKYLNMKFHKNPSSGKPVSQCRCTDKGRNRQREREIGRHEETKSRFSKFCECS